MKTRAQLLCGAVAGPLFLFIVLIQDYMRPGYNPRIHPLSLLSLGKWGWIQILNFVVAGVLNLYYARGLWKRLDGRIASIGAPLCVGIYGLALIVVGLFPTDPADGFPPGSIASAAPSWHGMVHALGALFVFIPLAISLVMFWRFFASEHQPGWASYAIVSAIIIVALFFGGVSSPLRLARMLRLATLVGWMAPAMVALRLMSRYQAYVQVSGELAARLSLRRP
jgi:hypothetical protein